MAAEGHSGRHTRLPHCDQGAADDTSGRGDTVAERGAAATSGFVRVRAAGEVFERRALAGEASGADEHHDLSREYRRRVRGNRVARGNAGSKEAARIPEQRDAEGHRETNPLGFRRGNQTDFDYGNEAPGATRDPICTGKQETRRDARAQGQYPEIHGRRIPPTGATSWQRKNSART